VVFYAILNEGIPPQKNRHIADCHLCLVSIKIPIQRRGLWVLHAGEEAALASWAGKGRIFGRHHRSLVIQSLRLPFFQLAIRVDLFFFNARGVNPSSTENEVTALIRTVLRLGTPLKCAR
jgi:hypothetical protein